MAHAIEVEIERNYAAFLDRLKELLSRSAGRYALFKNQGLEGIYDTAGQAERAGYKRFGNEPYSIQQITDEPVDLGFFSYAFPQGPNSAETHPSQSCD